MPFKKRKSLGGHRLQRGLEKLQPKWANPTAGKAFYFFFLSSVFMEISLLPSVSFWSVTDVADPELTPAQQTLTIFGAYACMDYTVEPKGLWPDDLCCVDPKTPDEQAEMAELEALAPSELAKDENAAKRDRLDDLRDMLKMCDPKSCPPHLYVIGVDGKPTKDVHDDLKVCKYYQYPPSMSVIIGAFINVASVSGILSAIYSLKAATKPNKCDLLGTKVFCTLGFLGFVFGLVGIALFTPGSRGDGASLAHPGFFLQMTGLSFLLGGVITVADAGQKDIVLPAVNFAKFAQPKIDESAKHDAGPKIAPAGGSTV